MNYTEGIMFKKLVFAGLVVSFMLVACAGNNPTVTVPAQVGITITPTQTRTFTHEPSSTPSLTPTTTATATVTSTATATPENFVLADSGYDIADVQITYQSEDIAIITFKYRLDQSITFVPTLIEILPPECNNPYYRAPYWLAKPYFTATAPVGIGEIIYMQTSEGECSAPYFDMAIYSMRKVRDGYAEYRIAYQERIKQPLKVVRSFPTINSKVLALKNISFRTTGSWSGQFTFDYTFSPEIPIANQKYRFKLFDMGDKVCGFDVSGPVITELEGTYIIDVDLKNNIRQEILSCLSTYSSYTFSGSILLLEDLRVNGGNRGCNLYQHAVDLVYTLKK
jgi:hypothetical protein